MSNNSAQFGLCSLLPTFLLAGGLNPRKRIGQTHLASQAPLFFPEEFRSKVVKLLNELLLDGEVEGAIVSTGTLTIGEQARVRGEIRTKSVNVRGTVEGNIFVTERCALQANCTVRGDIEAPRLVVNEHATFLGSAKVGTGNSLPA